RRIDGDPFRVVFLTVEGCRTLENVHLKELPQWFRTYEQVQRAYDMGLDERPLHVHRHWQALPDVDESLPPNPGFLFGPAEARSLIERRSDGIWLKIPPVHEMGFPGEEVHLGVEPARALQALVDLHAPAAAALRACMEAEDRKALRNGYADARRPLKEYVARIRSEGRLDGVRRALALQTEVYLQRLRQKKYGMGPESEALE
ncbi:MAG TPA: hypothetical protein VD902_05780, partial [Symbiobacteriaceae bacterium]|nr:hypothetical protein [Symbiobacteriaceae bacterium]